MTEPTDAELLAEWDRVSHIADAGQRRLACLRAVLAKWGTPPAVAGEHIPEWAKPHPRCDAGCMFQCTKGFAEFPSCATTPQAGAVPLTPEQITAAAKKLAECMEYPWDHMPEQGRAEMRKHARAVTAAANGSPPPTA